MCFNKKIHVFFLTMFIFSAKAMHKVNDSNDPSTCSQLMPSNNQKDNAKTMEQLVAENNRLKRHNDVLLQGELLSKAGVYGGGGLIAVLTGALIYLVTKCSK